MTSPPRPDAMECEAQPLVHTQEANGRRIGGGARVWRLLLPTAGACVLLGTLALAGRQVALHVKASGPVGMSSASEVGLVEEKARKHKAHHQHHEAEKKEDDSEQEGKEELITMLPQHRPDCGEAGDDCSLSGCCKGDHLHCYSTGFDQGVAIGGAKCKEFGDDLEVKWTRKSVPKTSYTTWKAHGVTCHSRFVAPPVPLTGTEHRGVELPATCYNGTGPHIVFIIGDWGGILPGRNGNNMAPRKYKHVAPADHTTFGGHMRKYVNATDEYAQFRVAAQMQLRAKQTNPDYVLNAGDAFYWGGIETHCGVPPYEHAHTGQWDKIFESMYHGPGLDGKQWLGVLGNHDYGGWMYLSAWDQVIGYTWGGPGSTGRWMMPAQYWKAHVYYDDFSVEYYFVDTNYFDSDSETHMSGHNICNGAKVGMSSSDTCGKQGPTSAHHCPAWFKKLWHDQKEWMDRELEKSKANWQIVVTHFPPTWGKDEWPAIARKHGIDLLVTGHKHQQEVHVPEDPLAMVDGWSGLYTDFMGGTGWIVSGGGGGVTSQGTPEAHGHDDQYGFMELELKRYTITIKSISHGGYVRSTKTLRPIPPSLANPKHLAYLTKEQVEMAKPNPDNCGMNKYTFYMYRAQDESNYKDQNINAANLAGVLWYLHHEVVMLCPRKFGITRIRRLKVTMQNTCDLYKDTKTQFGPYVAFDSGKCNVKGCEKTYYKYGSVIGCQHIPFNSGLFAAYCEYPNCGYAHWYSLPGPCTEEPIGAKTKSCKEKDPGGFCEQVTGKRDCTYNVEDAGEVSLDELYKTTTQYYPWKEFCKSQLEYNNQTDYGIGVKFWNGIYNPARCMSRYLNITHTFKKKYPHMPEFLPEPRCDYYGSDPKDYFAHTGSGFSRSFKERQLGS